MTALAAIRPDEWHLPLFLHLIAAMVMVGALVLAAGYLVPAWRASSTAALTYGFRSLLYAALPALVFTRITAQWLVSEQNLTDDPPTWVGIGFMTTDVGLLLLIVALAVSGTAVRRARRAGTDPGTGAARTATVIVSLLLVAYVVTIWAMTAKPG